MAGTGRTVADMLTALQEIRETVSNMRNSGEVSDGAHEIIVGQINDAIRDHLQDIKGTGGADWQDEPQYRPCPECGSILAYSHDEGCSRG